MSVRLMFEDIFLDIYYGNQIVQVNINCTIAVKSVHKEISSIMLYCAPFAGAVSFCQSWTVRVSTLRVQFITCTAILFLVSHP